MSFPEVFIVVRHDQESKKSENKDVFFSRENAENLVTEFENIERDPDVVYYIEWRPVN